MANRIGPVLAAVVLSSLVLGCDPAKPAEKAVAAANEEKAVAENNARVERERRQEAERARKESEEQKKVEQEKRIAAERQAAEDRESSWARTIVVAVVCLVFGVAIACKVKKDHAQQRTAPPSVDDSVGKGGTE